MPFAAFDERMFKFVGKIKMILDSAFAAAGHDNNFFDSESTASSTRY